MAGSGFEADLQEMESALLTIDGLVSDEFGAAGPAAAQARRPLSRLPFQNGAASDIQQADAATGLKRAAEADDAATFYGQGFTAAAMLDDAHGTLLATLLQLRMSIEQGIQALQQNLRATHQAYSATEERISMRLTSIAPMTT